MGLDTVEFGVWREQCAEKQREDFLLFFLLLFIFVSLLFRAQFTH